MPRRVKQRFLSGIRPMTREDMATTLGPVYQPMHNLKKLRDSHHRVARLLAVGLRLEQVAEATGYAIETIRQLAPSPAMVELVAKYRPTVDRAYEESVSAYYSYATRNLVMSERMLADRLEASDEDGKPIAVRDLIAVSADRADRLGFGKRSTQVNVNADFAAELEKAIERSGKVIELNPANRLRRLV